MSEKLWATPHLFVQVAKPQQVGRSNLAIRMVPDVVAPLTVTAVDLVSESVWPAYSNWVTYGMTIVGYGAAVMNKGGDFVKNIGVSSLPLTAKRVYDSLRAPATVSRGVAFRNRVARYPGPSQEAPFQGVKLT